MSIGVRVQLAEAEKIAGELVALLRPHCDRIEVAGSIRRRKPDVGDVEIVAVPRFETGGLFGGDRVDVLADALGGWRSRPLPGQAFAPHPRKAWGEKYKRLLHVPSGLQVDLFVVTPPACFAVIYAIRTGPAALSQRAVTSLRAKGMRCEEGRILRGDDVVPCPDEATFFRLAGLKYDPPEERW